MKEVACSTVAGAKKFRGREEEKIALRMHIVDETRDKIGSVDKREEVPLYSVAPPLFLPRIENLRVCLRSRTSAGDTKTDRQC